SCASCSKCVLYGSSRAGFSAPRHWCCGSMQLQRGEQRALGGERTRATCVYDLCASSHAPWWCLGSFCRSVRSLSAAGPCARGLSAPVGSLLVQEGSW